MNKIFHDIPVRIIVSWYFEDFEISEVFFKAIENLIDYRKKGS